MEKVTITRVFTKNRVAASGKPYTSMAIKTSEYGDVWISGFKNKSNSHWKEGDVVDVIIEKKGQYLNYSLPEGSQSRTATPSQDLARVFNILTEIKDDMSDIKRVLMPKVQGRVPTDVEYPENDLDTEEPPF